MEIKWVTWLLITLQLVKVIAGNDVITFNEDEEDLDESIDAIFEREQFMQVVQAHRGKSSLSPSFSNREPKDYQNTSSLKDNSRWDSSIRHPDAGRRHVTSSLQQQNTHKTYTSHPAGTKVRQGPGNVYNERNTSTLPQRSQKNTIPVIMWEELMQDELGNEDELTAMENLLLPVGDTQSPHSRYKRQIPVTNVEGCGDGDFIVMAQITLRTTGLIQDNQALRDALEMAILMFLQRFNEIFIAVTINTLTVPSTGRIVVVMEVQILYYEGATDQDVLLELARAFVELDNVNEFKAGNKIYDVSNPLVEDITDATTGQMRPAICYTCAEYQSCLQAVDETYYCGFRPMEGRLFPFGRERGDRTLPRGRESATAEITIESGIPYENQLYSSIFISVNGIISFDVPFASFNPQPLPVMRRRKNQQRLILAPYWCDLDLVNGDIGEVYYQLYLQGESNSVNAADIFAKANRDVLNFESSLRTYDASLVLVVTWYEIPPYPAEFSTDERVSFQCVIISDGESTYVTYVYGIGAMNFNPVLQRNVEIGWGEHNFATENAQASYYAFDTIPGNTNQNGLWFFKIGTYSNSAAKCLAWYHQNRNSRSDINFWNRIIPPCPCNELAAALSIFWIPSLEEANCYDIFPLFGSIGRRCCYRSRLGGFERRIPRAGSLQLSTPYYGDFLSHYLWDTQPKRWCCIESNRFCNRYYQLRPKRSCTRARSRRGFFFGDPHITLLDARTYDFNGLGEYTLIKIKGYKNEEESSSLDFILQGRTCQAQGSDGSPSLATVFCALAVENSNTNTTSGSTTVTTVSVEIGKYSDGTKYLILLVNEQDYTVRFRDDENFARFDGGVYLKRENGSLRISTPSNIGLTVQISNGLLDFSVELDEKFNGTTMGLMGNFNGNPNDDFVYPNGTELSASASEREIFHFGQAWQITADESLFQYPYGLNASNFRNDSFTPIFFSEITSDKLTEAEGVCGASSPMTEACIFDYVVTNDSNIAIATKVAEETFMEDEEKINNQAPNISASEDRIDTIVGQPTTVTFEATDPEGHTVTYTLVSTRHSDIKFSEENGVFEVVYTPTDMNSTIEIAVVATDDKGVVSEVAEVEIVQCSGCSGQGTCNFTRTQVTDNPNFYIATCDCEIGYSGADCENDKDGCEDDPCPGGTTCSDVTAADEQNTGMAYMCSDCPDGYQLNSTKCNDIDECSLDPPICGNNSICINKIGSYRCECKSGYRKSSVGQCVDINECVENQYDCHQICINTVGSYRCECEEGFKLGVFGTDCSKIPAADPCEGLADGDQCSYGCRNASGVAQCFCSWGYRLAADGTSCEDIDECEERLCSQKCENSEGSYQCSCFDGYVLGSDSLSCDTCPRDMYGPNCTMTCECRGHARLCDNVRGCICLDGWTGDFCEIDVDECELYANLCPEDKVCNNNNGSYTCDCPTGYQDISNNGSCYNINECLRPDVHGCVQGCIDNPGSYTCVCDEGYIYNLNTRMCEDINECNSGISGCEQLCDNMEGSFNCRCRPGFILGDDRKSCMEVPEIDPCEGLINNCEYGCIVENESAQCFCRIGYQLSSDNFTCIDINECEVNNTCSDDCENKMGSYSCSCPVGKKLQNDSRTCQVCDDYHWGENCSNECACSPRGTQTCDPVVGCVCKSGWQGTQCSLDIDECSASPCETSAICTNTAGSYRCTCRNGYQLDTSSQECVDIDECTTSLPCDHICNNTIGGYVCSCNTGFTANGDNCIDIDECANPELSRCDQLCRNTLGNFMCECYPGYVLNITTRNTCDRDPDAISCLVNNTCTESCRIEDGQDTCFCPPGYQLDVADNTTCIDVDECDNNPCINGTCSNYDGGYNCSCSDGTKLAMDMITCMVCESGTYGTDCASTCTCNATNTESCDPVDGNCNCSAGWEGNDCSTDIDECRQTSDPVACGFNAHCENDPGSYRCVCDTGFFRSGDQCLACDATSYGDNCANTCDCITANTADCNNVDGTCTCNSGWDGTICDTDINECADLSYCLGPFEACVNLNGSARCDCTSGYARPNPTDNCQDINECLLPTLVCNDTTKRCNNTEGSYDCFCKDGYLTNDDGSCTACNATSYGTNCSNTCDCIIANTADCDNVNGTCTCISGWNGTICDTDINECMNQSYCSGPFEVCVNFNGSARCDCSSGYERPNLSDNCQACNATSYGDNCSNTCDCITANTADCDNVNGTCTCISGWNGTICDTDINECDMNQSYCSGPFEVCVNLNGSARCDCSTGYVRPNPSDNCQACNATSYGDNCSNTCDCITANTADCDNVNGACTCNSGWEGTICDTDIKESNFEVFFVHITLGYININDDWFDTSTPAFKELQGHVEDALELFGKGVLGPKLLFFTVINFYPGSVIANTSLGIDKLFSDIPPADAARLLYQLSNVGTLIINGTSVTIGDVVPGASNESTIFDTTVCGFFEALNGTCNDNETCSEDGNGFPQCTASGNATATDSSSDSDLDLILGLAIGIPLFVILTAVIAILVYCYVRRRTRSNLQSSAPSVTREDPLGTGVIATRLATKGSWDAQHRFYSPDAFSDTGTSDSGNSGQLLKTRRTERSDFQDSPWFENRGATSSVVDAAESRGAADTGGPTSNFSWEYMFNLLEPHRGFEIQRPNVNPSPNPPHAPQGRRPDSMA